MTWLSRICFSALLIPPVSGATVSGSVELRDLRDPGVRKKKDYSGSGGMALNPRPAVPVRQ